MWIGYGVEPLTGDGGYLYIDRAFEEVGGDLYNVGFSTLPLGGLNGTIYFEIDAQNVETGSEGGERANGIWSRENVEYDNLSELIEAAGLSMPDSIPAEHWAISDEPFEVPTTDNGGDDTYTTKPMLPMWAMWGGAALIGYFVYTKYLK